MNKPNKARKVKYTRITEMFLEQEGPPKNFISKFIMRASDVDDIAQEAFIRAFRAEQKQNIEHPKAYLYRTARNLAFKKLTKKSHLMTTFIEDSCGPGVLKSEEDLEKQIGTLEKLERVKYAISNLPPQCQRVFIMRKVYGFSQKEISRQLGISTSTVEKHVIAGLKKIRNHIECKENVVTKMPNLNQSRKE